MCLILTTIAAVIATAVWYSSAKMRDMKVSVLCWLFWGAAIMWLVDLAFEYAEDGAVAVKTVEEDDAPEQEAEAAGNKVSASAAETGVESGASDVVSAPILSIEPSGTGEVAFAFSGSDSPVPGQPLNLVVKPSEKGVAIELAHVDGILNDTVLGLAVITLALVIWIAVLLISDPKGIVRAALLKKKAS